MVSEIWLSLPLWLQGLCIGFVSLWLVQIIYLFVVRMRPLWRMRQDSSHRVPVTEQLPSISVVVYAHNQSNELMQNLPLLLDSDYPDFEVIVVDDGSTDDTEMVLRRMDQRSEHFFHTTVAERIRTVSHHKLAMLLGVKAAHNDVVLLTQAQCMPATPQWLRSIGRLFVDRVDAVIGPVVYESRSGVFNLFRQWDFFDRMLSSMSITLSVGTFGGWSYNMAFRKEVFYADHNRALQRHLGLHPGEDDLFLSEVSKGDNVTVACSADSVVVVKQSPDAYDWKNERLNRAFTHGYYRCLPLFIYRLDVITRVLCILSGLGVAVMAGLMQSWWVMGVAIGLLLIYAVTYVLIPYFTAQRLSVHRYRLVPLAYVLYLPWVDLYYKVMAAIKSHQFYVSRID
ncbi:MAG: glycosyltransferase [Bacteroidales bacterium]|nr:glycosyltransferase [Bacteroidales bacterium]